MPHIHEQPRQKIGARGQGGEVGIVEQAVGAAALHAKAVDGDSARFGGVVGVGGGADFGGGEGRRLMKRKK